MFMTYTCTHVQIYGDGWYVVYAHGMGCTRMVWGVRAWYRVSWPSGLVHWTQVLVLSECGFESRPSRGRGTCVLEQDT